MYFSIFIYFDNKENLIRQNLVDQYILRISSNNQKMEYEHCNPSESSEIL